MKSSSLTLLVGAALLLAPAPRVRAAQGFTVNAGNIVHVMLTQPVSTRTNRPGDKILAQCAGGDCGGFPRGTKFYAVLSEVIPASGSQPGSLHGSFTTAVLPDGRHIPIVATAAAGGDLEGATTTQKGNKKKTAAIGAATGALAGGDLGGALVGGAIGGALGRKKKTTGQDIEVPGGTEFQIRILQKVTVKPTRKK
jgi:hypothetical protein